MRCATEIQLAMGERDIRLPSNQRIDFRIGINVGDIMIDYGDIFGDGANVAARLEALAEPGGVACLIECKKTFEVSSTLPSKM